jgi:hypothetical protein
MDSIIRNLRIEHHKAQLALSNLVCDSLAEALENPSLNFSERAAIAKRWGKVRQAGHLFQLLLDLLQREERKSR